jgi:hypothetical protein
MAKHVIAEQYTFTPLTKTITISNRYLRQEQLMLITNTTKNVVMYNFSDPNLGATVTNVINTLNAQPTCTIVLNYNTAAHSSSDKISILVEETSEQFIPQEVLVDPVNKLRVSQPQSLIDTDFEYSPQATKWETLNMINNRPFAYINTFVPLNISDITATTNSRSISIQTVSAHGLSAGTPINVQDTLFGGADGTYMIDSVTSTTIVYTCRYTYTSSTGTIYNANTTTAYQAFIYSQSAIPMTSGTYSGNLITITTTGPHGLAVGNEIALTGTTASTNAPNGSWIVCTVLSPTVFVFVNSGTPTGTLNVTSTGQLYVRPLGSVNHRAFDGGVTFSTNAASHNQQLIRQTRRYFRYQSGKGMQMSTGTILEPNITVDQIISSGTTCTVYTKYPHNIQIGAEITVSGCNETAYNGVFKVLYVLDTYRIVYTALSTPSSIIASGNYVMSISGWYGGSTRVGLFDSQNGVFFEYDGQNVYAVKRSSTFQLSGFVALTAGSSTVTSAAINGINTVFSKQLTPGDWIVLKGMSYRVDQIASDTSMTIIPAFRGSVNVADAVVTRTIDTRTISSNWNIDKCNGTGISGFNLDLTKMQMFYLDYSWYGAGFIRWGFRGATGDIVYCHKLPNNNVNYEAYMRSGNLPARYETTTYPAISVLTLPIAQSDTTVTVASTAGFNTTGSVVIKGGTNYEYINYTGITATQFTGCSRGQSGGTITVSSTTLGSNVLLTTNTGGIQIGQYIFGTGIQAGAYVTSFVSATSITMSISAVANGTSVSLYFAPLGVTAQSSGTFTLANASTTQPSGTNPIAVEQHSPLYSSTISHWGTSVIMDGRFDDDKSYVFTKGMVTTLPIAGNVTNAVMSIRVAPSVSNGVIGATLGIRELVNRMQLVLRQLDVFSNGSFLMTCVLNGVTNSATPNWQAVGGSSLCQYIFHTSGTTVQGGETVFGFYLNNSGATAGSTTQQELNLVRDLGTSILSGGTLIANTGIYPDGPDVITITATNLAGQSGNLQARLSWTEAQA